MKSREIERLAVVGDLLVLARPLEEIASQLAGMDWDFEGNGVEVRKSHLQSVLRRFLDASMTADEVERWANLLEVREDVYLQVGSEQQIGIVLHELANPLLTQSLNLDRANVLLRALV